MNAARIQKWIVSYWWVFYALIVILLMFQVEVQWTILLIAIGVVGYVLVKIATRSGTIKVSKSLHGVARMTETELVRLTGVDRQQVHAFLHDISRNPDASGIAILVKGEYIYYSNNVIKEFKKKYRDGMTISEIIADMPEIETRLEYRRIVEKLADWDELPERKKPVEE